MSKVKLEIDLDDIVPCDVDYTDRGDEKYVPVADTFSEYIKNKVIEKVTEQTSAKVTEMIDKSVSDIVAKQTNNIEKVIGEKLNTLMEEFFTTPFDRRDNYGDVVEKDVTVKSMLKKACDFFANERVNSNGEPYTGSYYNNSTTRAEYMLKKVMKDDMEFEIKRMSDNAMAEIKKRIMEATQKNLGKKLADLVGIDDMLFNDAK